MEYVISSKPDRASTRSNNPRKLEGKRRKKSVLFIDFPNLACGVRYNFYELFKNLGREYDEIRTYAKIPKEPTEERDVFGILRVATNSGAFPTLCPSDVDGFLVEEIRKTLERRDISEIALLSGDNGFYGVLRTCKRMGFRITVIVPPLKNTNLLISVADEVRTIEEFANEYVRSSETKDGPSLSRARATVEERSEVSVTMMAGER